ncbi:hypothetical protein B566_EDAN018175 [Ephemera danica]|nr:hypothetical protein B566_EDAN018175 [Ephemera danica]
MQKNIVEITNEVFKLLHKFAGSGQGKGDTFDLANAAFKSTGDSARQATAFTLLRASLRRRVHTEELTQVMHTVATLAVASETAYSSVIISTNVSLSFSLFSARNCVPTQVLDVSSVHPWRNQRQMNTKQAPTMTIFYSKPCNFSSKYQQNYRNGSLNTPKNP